MVRHMTATELKATLLAVLDEVAAGDEVEITKRGRVVARLTPAVGPHALRGACTGVAVAVSDEQDLFSTDAPWSTA